MAASKTTLGEIFEEWSNKHSEKVSKATMHAYKSAFKKLEQFHNTPLTALRTAHIQSVMDNYAYSTAKNIKIIIGLVFREGMKKQIIKENIAELLDLPERSKKKIKKPFTPDEINLLWSKAGETHADMLLVLLYTGLRISELFAMETQKIDLQNRLMVGGLKTEAGTDRTIPIHKKIVPIIERVCGETYLFQSPRGKKFLYSNEGYRLNKFMRSLGFDHTIHETRHTFISQCDRLSINKISIKRMVGHSTKEKDITDDVYTHKNADDLLAAIDAFDY